MNKTEFNYFVSDADANMYNQYQLGLSKALERFSVDGVVLTTIERNAKEDTYVICAHSAKHQTIAGIRLEVKSNSNFLPIEKCDVPQRKLISYKIERLTKHNKSIAELSGLWVSAEHKGADLGRRLVLEATELALGLGVNTLIAMPPGHTIKYFTSLGYVADTEIPQLAYPDDRYISTVILFVNPNTSQQISEIVDLRKEINT